MASNNDTAAWVEQRLGALGTPGGPRLDPERAWVRLVERRKAASTVHRWVWMAAVSAAACLVLAGFPAPRVLAARCVSACATETAKLGQFVLASFSAPRPAARILAPDFALSDGSGRPVRLSDFRGKVVLLNFFATWCTPCKREIPWFVEFQRAYPDLVVLGVALDEDGWQSVQPFASGMHINYRLMLGTEDLTRLYGGLQSVPTTLAIDRDGRIAAVHIGLVSKTEYEAEIVSILKESQP